jgi:FixJ family two-component response regulator
MLTKRNIVAVIDDNLGILSAMSRLLAAYGYDTELYASPQEFLDAAMTSEATGLIVDIQLGDKCGIELVRKLANLGIRFPVIFMTANDSEWLKRRALETGCAAFLRKPFAAGNLIEALEKLPRPNAIEKLCGARS